MERAATGRPRGVYSFARILRSTAVRSASLHASSGARSVYHDYAGNWLWPALQILGDPMIRPKRKVISLSVKLESLLIVLRNNGVLREGPVEWHHEPPLVCRPLNADGTDTDPPMNDPAHIVPMQAQAHKERTPGDLKIGAKLKRLEKAEAAHKAVMSLDELPWVGEPFSPLAKWKRRIPSRPFPPKGQRKM